MSIEHTDAESAAVAVAPRVSLASMEAKIVARYDINGADAAFHAAPPGEGQEVAVPPSLEVLSICLLVMENGFTVIGKAAPASAENFNPELGKKFAYEDAIRQLWPLEGYLLRSQLAR
jgi:hypothetical protein